MWSDGRKHNIPEEMIAHLFKSRYSFHSSIHSLIFWNDSDLPEAVIELGYLSLNLHRHLFHKQLQIVHDVD